MTIQFSVFLTTVVEKGGKVMGLVVLNVLFWSCCACTFLLDWVG